MKPILLFCLMTLATMMICEKAEMEGELLMKIGNLSHRGLGILYWQTILQPHRSDYARTYLIQYLIATDGNLIQEGQRRPVVPMLAVYLARQFPKDRELDVIAKIVMFNHFKKLDEDLKKDDKK